MQKYLLHRGISALTASVRSCVLPTLRYRPFTQQKRPSRPTRGFQSYLKAASALEETSNTELGAQTGIPEITETSNVPVSAMLKFPYSI